MGQANRAPGLLLTTSFESPSNLRTDQGWWSSPSCTTGTSDTAVKSLAQLPTWVESLTTCDLSWMHCRSQSRYKLGRLWSIWTLSLGTSYSCCTLRENTASRYPRWHVPKATASPYLQRAISLEQNNNGFVQNLACPVRQVVRPKACTNQPRGTPTLISA